MIIKSIKISNFRQYRNESTIELDKLDGQNINIIIGSTGAGKTNLSNAIQWCLYGIDVVASKSMGLLNMNTFEELREGERAEVKVELLIKTEKEEMYTVSRTINIEKKDNEQVTSGTKEGVLKIYFHRTDIAPVQSYKEEDPNGLINDIVPPRIKEYFFFDGEKLEQYFSSSSADNIKKSVFNISQLDLLESAMSKLESIIKDYRKQASKEDPQSEELSSKIDDAEGKVKELEAKRESTNKIIADLREHRGRLIEDFKRMGGESTKKILEENENIERLLPGHEEKLTEKEEEKRILLMSSSFLFLGLPAFEDATRLFKEAEEKGTIPPAVDPTFIETILRKGKCICGNDVSENNKQARVLLVDFLDKISSEVGKDPRKLLEIERDILNIEQNFLPNFIEELKLLNEPIKMNRSEIERLKKQMVDNLAQISISTKLENVDWTTEKIEEFNSEIEKAVENKTKVEKDLDDTNLYLDSLRQEHIKKIKQNDKNLQLLTRINFCTSARDEAAKIMEQMMNEIREEISIKTAEYYQDFHWKKKEGIQVLIDENYHIVVVEKNRAKFGAFSRGENALLAMSFIFALHSVSGFNAPLVLDTALGRIDEAPKANWGANVSKYLKDTQLILLFTSSEFSDNVQKNLKENIASQYVISSQKNPWDEAYLERIR